MKTGILFGLCFCFGWIFGGGDLGKIDHVQQLALHFGRAFQILDDIDDLDQDTQTGRQINYALRFGLEEACTAVARNVDDFCLLARRLGIEGSPITALTSQMRETVFQGR